MPRIKPTYNPYWMTSFGATLSMKKGAPKGAQGLPTAAMAKTDAALTQLKNSMATEQARKAGNT
jgi:hypothetical protein